MRAAPAPSSTRRNDVTGSSIDIEALKSATRQLLWNVGISYSANKVARLVVDWIEHVEHNGVPFLDYLLNRLALDDERRAQLLRDPSSARVLVYADPTGETAVRNVVRTRGY